MQQASRSLIAKYIRFLPLFVVFLMIGMLQAESSLAEPASTQSNIPAPAVSPKQEVSNTIDKILEVVAAYPENNQAEERRQKLREVIDPKFDFSEMAKRSLGAQWKEQSPAEQEEFVRLFSDLLAKTYLSKIETVKPGMVKIDSERIELPKALVRTSITSKGDVFPLDYKLLVEAGSWRVYDVIIENIGLVANYRNEFAGIIRKEKFSGLLERLRKKSIT